MQWYIKVLRNYRDFSGRATRTEYWMFFLYNLIIIFALRLLQGLIGVPPVLNLVYSLLLLVPSLALTFRRLHDTGKSAWWLLICLVPYAGVIVILIFACLQSEGNNRYGYNLIK